MTRAHVSVIRDLKPAEMMELLARNNVGRIAYSFHDKINIEPIHYVVDDGWIYGRTSLGEKLETIKHHRWVALEVDEVKDALHWRSVVAHGAIYLLDGDTEQDEQLRQKAIALLRGIVPEAFTDKDPVPYRQILFRIPTNEMTGRTSD